MVLSAEDLPGDYPESYFREYGSMEQLFLPQGDILLRDPQGPSRSTFWLLLPTGTAVAYLTTFTLADRTYLSEIEVRREYRGAGLSLEMIRSVEDFLGLELHSTGIFTVEGASRIERYLKESSEAMTIMGESGSFVLDWHLLIPSI